MHPLLHTLLSDGNTGDEIAFQEIAETVKEISDTLNEWKEAYGIEYAPSFNVTGGEPFLRKDLFDIIAEIINGDLMSIS